MNEKSIKILKGFIFLAKLVAVVFGIGIIALTTNSIFDDMEKHNPQEVIQKEYGECAFFNDETFISDGKLYAYKYDKDGQLHVFYVEDVKDKVVTGRGKEKQDE
mgnify:FL=1